MPYHNPFLPPSPTRQQLDESFYRMASSLPANPSAAGGGVNPTINPANIAQGAIAGISDITQTIGMANQSLNLGQPGDAYQLSATGQPVYTGGRFASDVRNATPQGVTAGETIGNVASDAAAGASIGGLPGAAIGAGFGLVRSLVGGRIRKRRQREEKEKAMNLVTTQANQFNEASKQYDEEQAAMTGYRRRRDMTNRLYNLYSLPT